MSFIELVLPKNKNGLGYGTTAEQVTHGLDLSGRTVLVTGCNSGLGYETMRVLSLRGARVIGTARTFAKARAACQSVSSLAVPFECELAQPQNIRSCIQDIKSQGFQLDAIIANAGIMALPKLQQAYGTELQFFTNHIGHFILITGLLDQLTQRGRVVLLSSAAHFRAPRGGIEFENLSGEKSYSAWTAYGQSKMANLLFAKQLARRLAGTQKTANALHPGVIATPLVRHIPALAQAAWKAVGPLALKSIPQGAATQVYAAVHPSMEGISGAYLADCNIAQPRRDAEDPELAQRLWDVSEALIAKLED